MAKKLTRISSKKDDAVVLQRMAKEWAEEVAAGQSPPDFYFEEAQERFALGVDRTAAVAVDLAVQARDHYHEHFKDVKWRGRS